MASRGDGDDTVVTLTRRASLLPPGKAEPEPPPEPEAEEPAAGMEDDLIRVPRSGDPYEALSRINTKPLTMLRFVIGDKVRALPYANLDSCDLVPPAFAGAGLAKPGLGPVIVLVFTGVVPRKAVITGRHLLLLHDLLCEHRVAWLRELPKGRDFLHKDATVITGITIERLEESPE